MPIAANTVIVVGSATTWPTACSRCERPKRVKSGMLSDSVAQKPIIAVSDGTNTLKKAPKVVELARLRHDRAEAVRAPDRPADEERGHHEHERRRPVLDLAQKVHAAIDDEDVEAQKSASADPLAGRVTADGHASTDGAPTTATPRGRTCAAPGRRSSS